jgi:ATP-binding cassette subfamily F protein 3
LLEALRRFPGTVIIVSHDRFILNELVNEVLEVGQGHAIRYLGNYDDYLAKKEAMENASAPASKPDHSAGASHAHELRGTNGQVTHPKSGKSKNVETSNDDRDAMRKRERMARQRSQIEKQIEQKETERAALSAEMNDPNFYLARKDADDLIKRYEQLGREIETLYADLVKFESPAAASEN